MSVLIRDMEMPGSCATCHFCHTENFRAWCCITEEDIEVTDMTAIQEDCPLSEEPERKKGKWEKTNVITDAYDISGVKTWGSKMMCDQCGFTTIAIEGHFSQYSFCPNCGSYNGGE